MHKSGATVIRGGESGIDYAAQLHRSMPKIGSTRKSLVHVDLDCLDLSVGHANE